MDVLEGTQIIGAEMENRAVGGCDDQSQDPARGPDKGEEEEAEVRMTQKKRFSRVSNDRTIIIEEGERVAIQESDGNGVNVSDNEKVRKVYETRMCVYVSV